MSKCEKQVVTKLNKKLEKYGLSREELELKLHSASLYGSTVKKMSELEYVRENYCSNRDVVTGNYDCPYATTVMNTICCTGHECNHKGIYEKPVVNNSRFATFNPTPYEDIAANLLANSLSDEAFPF